MLQYHHIQLFSKGIFSTMYELYNIKVKIFLYRDKHALKWQPSPSLVKFYQNIHDGYSRLEKVRPNMDWIP